MIITKSSYGDIINNLCDNSFFDIGNNINKSFDSQYNKRYKGLLMGTTFLTIALTLLVLAAINDADVDEYVCDDEPEEEEEDEEDDWW